MRTRLIRASHACRTLSALLAVLAQAVQTAGAWVAFNDHVPGAIGTLTSPNATTFNAITGSGGPLKDIETGTSLAASVIIRRTGSPAAGSAGSSPYAGTDAASTFDGFVYFGGSSYPTIKITTNDSLTYVFTNLAPARIYSFAGSMVRGSTSGGPFPQRWTLCEILGTADGNTAFVSAHTAGTKVVTNGAPFSPSAVAPNAVAIQSGDNREGDVARWLNIRPASNGTFSIRCTQYTGPIPTGGTATNKELAYAIDGFRLEEFGSGPSVRIAQPADGQLFDAPAKIDFLIHAPDSGATVTNIVVFANGSPVLRGGGSPLSGTWTNAPAGAWTLLAQATDDMGLTATSSPVTVEVLAPPLAVAALAPTPGTRVTTLASVSVLFSKPVTGVEAGDLWMNATPCARLTGSGAGPYVFGFDQPPPGTLVFGWAPGHGIRDLSGGLFAGVPWSVLLDPDSASSGIGPPYRLVVSAPPGHLPGAPFPVRVELRRSDGTLATEVWDADATLSASDPDTVLPTNSVHLYNGMGSALLVVTNPVGLDLTVALGRLQASRTVRARAAEQATFVAGTLPGTNEVWSGVVRVTGNVTVPPAATLTVDAGTLVLIDGVTGGTGVSIRVQGRLYSLGTEEQPVAFTVSSNAYTWGEMSHTAGSQSTFRNTFISKGGRSAASGHTSSGPMIRMAGCTNIYDRCSLTDATLGGDTAGKIMIATGGCSLVLADCLLTRALMGPEIAATGAQCDNTYFLEMCGSRLAPEGTNDNDGIYIHSQGSRVVSLRDCVIARTEDDGIDTLGSTVEIENAIIRNCDNINEDSKGISVYGGQVTVRRCLLADNKCGISGKDYSAVRIFVESSTVIAREEYALGVLNKTGDMFPGVNVRATNCIFQTQNTNAAAIFTSYNPADIRISYCAIGSAWGGATNCTFMDPRFVSAVDHDYRLQAGSPCIDSGDPASPPDTDGSRSDIGCFTYAPPPPFALQPAMSGGGFGFMLRLTPYRNYILQRSGDLVAWEDWGAMYCTNEPVTVVDQDAANHPALFYRVRLSGGVQP